MIRRTLPFLCTCVLTLSVGIGIVTGVFSLLSRFVSGPAARQEPQSYFRIFKRNRDEGAVATFPQYLGFRDQVRSARELAAWSAIPLSAPLGSDGAPAVRGTLASCNFFKVFEVTPLAGGLLRAEDCYSAHTVVVISERLWRDRFSADPDIGGEAVVYGAHPVTIIGVAPGFSTGQKDSSDLWFPYTLHPYLKDTLTSEKTRDLLREEEFPWLNLAGRLRFGYSGEAAAAEFRSMGADKAIVLTNGSMEVSAQLPAWTLLAIALAVPVLALLAACLNATLAGVRNFEIRISDF